MIHHFLRKLGIAMNDLIQRGITEHREPQQRKGERNNQRAQYEFTDGTTA